MPHTLADLDAMTPDETQGLSLTQRDYLLDLIIADGRATSPPTNIPTGTGSIATTLRKTW